MGHGKLNMKLIPKENVRLSTYQKRKKSLTKKAQEFSILCGVETCLIVYGPKLKSGTAELEIWPPDPDKVTSVIEKFQNKSSDLRERKRCNVFDFFAVRQKKLEDEFFKLRKANTGAKFPTWDDGINNYSVNQIRELISKLDSNMEAAKKQIEMVKGKLQQGLIEESSKSRILAGPRTIMNQPRFDVPSRQQQQPMSGLISFDMSLPSYNYPSDHHFGVTSSRPPQQPLSALHPLDMNVQSSYYNPFGFTNNRAPQQPMSGLKSFDMNIVPSNYNYPFGPRVEMEPPFNLNPMTINNSMTTVLCKNSSGYTTQVDGDISAGSSSITCNNSSLSAQMTPCFDPATPMLNNVLCSNPWGVPVCFYGPFMQSTVPSFPSHQLGEFYPDINADLYGSRNKKQKF